MSCKYLSTAGLVALLATALSIAPAQSQQVQVPYARGGVAGVPNYYVVRDGDTLSRICEAYFRNPYVWPRVWSYNPQITNPHWIYPGDVIFLRPPADPSTWPSARPPGRPGTHYPLAGFYTGSELESVGFIRFSPTPYRSLSLFDEVYLEFEEADSVQIGDRFALNRIVGRLYDPEDDDILIGVKYLVTGVIEITDRPQDSPLLIGRVIMAWDVIERGDVLFVNQILMRVVESRPATVNLEGTIIDFLEPTTYAAGTFYVFIDRGYNQGVREGNRFAVWAREDEYIEWSDGEPGFHEKDNADLIPWRVVGEAIVIFTTNDYSTAVLTYSAHELPRHMRVTLTEGI
ncbi:MAG: LysM peptidoglycan-binding domain-containing protein [Bradymonadales bacterium]|nr:LysM peptidoglycan-binding domain-containing protein [Bradymonadales bacterium]